MTRLCKPAATAARRALSGEQPRYIGGSGQGDCRDPVSRARSLDVPFCVAYSRAQFKTRALRGEGPSPRARAPSPSVRDPDQITRHIRFLAGPTSIGTGTSYRTEECSSAPPPCPHPVSLLEAPRRQAQLAFVGVRRRSYLSVGSLLTHPRPQPARHSPPPAVLAGLDVVEVRHLLVEEGVADGAG